MKIIIIPLCLIGFAAAGVLDGRWMHDERLNRFKTGYDDRDYEMIDDTYKYGTTKTELDRQKILLKLLDHVHETLKDMDMRTVRDEFDDNEVNYKKSIDQDMLYVIQLHRSGRLLGKRDIFTVLDLTHKRQMIGLKRLLTRAKDFDIFVQNAVTARNRMNGVLFVNALLLAVRERDDTRHLIVPAVHEILPELYVDRQTLHKLLNVDMNLLTTSNGYETRRPKFHDIMGLHNGIDVLETRGTFWNGLGNLVTRRYDRFDVNDVDDNKLVIDEVEKHVKVKTIKLLTEDVGFKGFLHHLINDICLKENELEKVDGIEWNGMTRGRDWERMRENTFDKRYHSLDSKEWKSDYHSRDRFYDTIDVDGVLDKSWHQRKLNDLDVTHLDKHCIKCINRKMDKDCRTCLLKTSDDLLNELDYDCKQCIRNVNVYDCDKCKMKIERTDLVYRDDDVGDVTNDKLWYGRRGLMDYKTHNQLHTKCIKCIERQNHVDCDECKRFTNDDIMEELDLDCKRCIRHMTYDDCEKCKEKLSTGMINLKQKKFSDSSDKIVELDIVCEKCIKSKSQQLCNMCLNTIDNWTLQRLDHHCKKCIQNLDDYSCDKCLVKRDHSVKWNNVDYDDKKKTTTAEVLLHNLRQVLTRINLERLSLDLDKIEDLEVRNGRVDVEIIKTKIMQKLRNTKIDVQRAQIMDIEKLIAKALIKNDNDINLLDILSDIIVSDVKGRGGDMEIVSEIGEAMSDDKVIRILRKIFATIDMVRTEILGTYKLHDLIYDDVKIDDIKVLGFETHLKPKDIDMKNLLTREVEKVVVVRQQQLTHKDFNIKIEVEAKRQQRAVMRVFIGPKKVDDMGRMLSLNERRLGYMLLDTKVIDLHAGRNVLETKSRDLIWTKRDTTTLREIYKRIFLGNREDVDIIGVGHDCRFPQRLVLPRGHINGAEFELFVIITRLDGDVVMQRSDMTTKCVMGWSDKGVDDKSLGFPFDRLIDVDTRDLRQLDNVVGVDVKIYHDERNGLNWW